MADLLDVQNAICSLIEGVLYPNGQGGAGEPQVPVRIYPGWPVAKSLDDDIPAGDDAIPLAYHVSVFAMPSDRVTSRGLDHSETTVLNPHTYAVTLAGQVVTISGAAPNPYYAHNFAVLIGGVAYTVQATAGQTAADVAQALGAVLAVDYPTLDVTGAVVTLPDGVPVAAARVGAVGVLRREVRTQEKPLRISLWTDTPDARSDLAKQIDPVLSDTPFLTLEDGTKARFQFHGGGDVDTVQRQGLYRRDLVYLVEWSTIRTETLTEITVFSQRYREAASDAVFADFDT